MAELVWSAERAELMNADRWQQVVALSAGEEEILPLRTTDPQYQRVNCYHIRRVSKFICIYMQFVLDNRGLPMNSQWLVRPPPPPPPLKQMSFPIHKQDGSALIFISHLFQWTYLDLVAKVRKLSSKSNMANLAVVAVVPVWGSIYKAHIEVIDEEGKTDLLVASQSSANSTAFNIKKKEVLALLEVLKHFLAITYLVWIFPRLPFYPLPLHGKFHFYFHFVFRMSPLTSYIKLI